MSNLHRCNFFINKSKNKCGVSMTDSKWCKFQFYGNDPVSGINISNEKLNKLRDLSLEKSTGKKLKLKVTLLAKKITKNEGNKVDEANMMRKLWPPIQAIDTGTDVFVHRPCQQPSFNPVLNIPLLIFLNNYKVLTTFFFTPFHFYVFRQIFFFINQYLFPLHTQARSKGLL